jgi:Flp pilus assembly protein TadG
MRLLHVVRRFARRRHGGASIEFALVVPICFMVVWAIISFARAYQRLNTLTASLREGARAAAVLNPTTLPAGQAGYDNIKNRILAFSTAYGYTLDTARVSITTTAADVTVAVAAYPLFAGLNFIGGLQNITVNRSAIFRLEGGS